MNFDGNTAPQLNTMTSGNDVLLSDGERLSVTLKGIRDNDYFDGDASKQTWEVFQLTNDVRENHNLPLLTLSEGLTAGAQIRAQEISTLGDKMKEYGHTRPSGLSAFTVLQKKYLTVGENLEAVASSPEAVMGKWISSASHYTNIVNPDYLKLGVGYVENDSDLSDQRFYWMQMFAAALSSTEKVTVNAAELLNASVEVNAVTKAITLTEGDDIYANTLEGATIAAFGGADSVSNDAAQVLIDGGDGYDSISNSGANVTINSGDGNDYIDNSGDSVSICGGEYSDVVISSGSNVTIDGGADNDRISLGSAATNNRLNYTLGDGNDYITGFNATDTLQIGDGSDTYATVASGGNIIVSAGTGLITLEAATRLGSRLNIAGTEGSKTITLTEGNDTYTNIIDGATILALGGDDNIRNETLGTNVSIDLSDGDDSVSNYGNNVKI